MSCFKLTNTMQVDKLQISNYSSKFLCKDIGYIKKNGTFAPPILKVLYNPFRQCQEYPIIGGIPENPGYKYFIMSEEIKDNQTPEVPEEKEIKKTEEVIAEETAK